MPYDIAGALQYPNTIANGLAAGRQGMADGLAAKQRADQNKLADLSAQAYTAPADQRNALIGQAVGVDPTAGMALDKQLQSNETDHAKKIGGAARYMAQALQSKNPAQIEGAYQAVRPYLAELGQAVGKVPPANWDPSMEAGVYQIVAQTNGDLSKDIPSGFQQFEMTARAAGLQPGTPEYQQAANIALGREGRASNAGIGFQKVTGPDGRERIGRSNPRTGAFEVYNEQTGQFEQMGGAAMGAAGGAPAAQRPTPQELMAQAAQMANQGGPAANTQQADAWIQQQMQANGYSTQPANNGLGVSRSPEETAAAVETAKQQTGLQFLPRTEAVKTQAAIQQAAGTATATEAAKAQSSFAQSYPQKLTNSENMLSVLDKAIASPGRELVTGISGKIDPRAYMPGGKAAAFKAILDQINGKTFLEAYNTLKGGGQITEVEGQKATQAMARLNTAQSDEDFLAALKEFRGVVANGLDRLKQQNANFSGQTTAQPSAAPTSGVLRYNPATGRIE